MSTEKEVYTPELKKQMKADYLAAGTGIENEAARAKVVEDYATRTGKSVFSVRGVMSRENYYIAKVKVSKDGATPAARKEVLVAEIVKLTGLNPVRMETLASANKTALQGLVDWIKDTVEETAETE